WFQKFELRARKLPFNWLNAEALRPWHAKAIAEINECMRISGVDGGKLGKQRFRAVFNTVVDRIPVARPLPDQQRCCFALPTPFNDFMPLLADLPLQSNGQRQTHGRCLANQLRCRVLT